MASRFSYKCNSILGNGNVFKFPVSSREANLWNSCLPALSVVFLISWNVHFWIITPILNTFLVCVNFIKFAFSSVQVQMQPPILGTPCSIFMKQYKRAFGKRTIYIGYSNITNRCVVTAPNNVDYSGSVRMSLSAGDYLATHGHNWLRLSASQERFCPMELVTDLDTDVGKISTTPFRRIFGDEARSIHNLGSKGRY
jgi:hypothetical protein